MRQCTKRYKTPYKEFHHWMASEIDDIFPEIALEDPLERFYNLLDKNPLNQISSPESQSLITGKPPQATKSLRHGPNFSICKYWKQLSSQSIESFIKFLDAKDLAMLMKTCKYVKKELDQESVWKIVLIRDFPSERLRKLRDDAKDRVSEKLYYKYLYLSTVSGIPYHSGYFKGSSSDFAKLCDSIVDFVCPKTEMIKKYASEIFMRNQCKIFDFKLSWLKEKKEICLWNGNPSLEFKKLENTNEEIQTIHKFYPCFIKRYSMIDQDEEFSEMFFLEDRYLVVKLFKKLDEEEKPLTIFRILNFEEELHFIAKGLQPATPVDYSFTILLEDIDTIDEFADINSDEFGADFTIYQEKECQVKINLLSGDKAVFYTENSVKPTMIFWDLKEKKKIDMVSLRLHKPLNSIIASKKSELIAEKVGVFILDENMNVYCGSLSEKEGFILNQSIILPTQNTENEEKQQAEKIEKDKELEAFTNLNSGKKAISKDKKNPYYGHLFPAPPPKYLKELDQKFESKTRRFSHEIRTKTREEWLIVHSKDNFHFVDLDNKKIQEFSADKYIGLLEGGNWTVFEDNLLVTKSTKIMLYKINFEEHNICFRGYRQFCGLDIRSVVKEWILLDPCFTVMIFTHTYGMGLSARATIIVTSTQEFLYNTDSDFNSIYFKIEADQFIRIPDRWENKPREIDMKFENSKVLVTTEKANFFFDMALSAQPYNKVHLNGWRPKNLIHAIKYPSQSRMEAKSVAKVEEEETKAVKPKMVNHRELTGNLNTANAKEKKNGWKKGGKSQAKKEEDKEHRVAKGKGDKYQKNLRQSQRSEKIN